MFLDCRMAVLAVRAHNQPRKESISDRMILSGIHDRDDVSVSNPLTSTGEALYDQVPRNTN